MIYRDWEGFWWNNITGSNMVVTKAAEALSRNKMVILIVPSDLPWRHHMRSAIEQYFRKDSETENIYIQIIDVGDDCVGIAPGEYLLSKYGKTSIIKKGYREKSNISLQQYLIENRVLKNTVVWAKGFKTEQIKEWMSFCRGYNSNTIVKGLFVLEIPECNNESDLKKAERIRFNDYVSNYDVQLFDSFILSNDLRYSAYWKKYISTVTSVLCDTDAELSLELLKNIDFQNKDPIAGFVEIDKLDKFASRGEREAATRLPFTAAVKSPG